jgi:hypothetical protein
MSIGRASGLSRSTGRPMLPMANSRGARMTTTGNQSTSWPTVTCVAGPIATAHSQAGEAQRSPPPELGPLPGYARARPPGCLPDQVGRAAASRPGSGRLPRGAKREAARIAVDRSPDRPLADPSRYIGRNLHSRRSTRDHLINVKHRIMDGGNSIRDCASFLATALHSAEYCDPSLECSAGRSGGSATSTGSTPSRSTSGIPPTWS